MSRAQGIEPGGPTREERELELELAGPLNRWAEQEQALVDRAVEEAGPRDRERARELERLALGERAGRPARRTVALAAAVLVVGLLVGWLARGLGQRGSAEGSEPPVFLGPGDELLLAPLGAVPELDAFRWLPARESGETYSLRVWRTGEDEPALARDGLTAETYAPTAEERALLGDAIRWEVHRVDGGGQLLRVLGWGEAWRSP